MSGNVFINSFSSFEVIFSYNILLTYFTAFNIIFSLSISNNLSLFISLNFLVISVTIFEKEGKYFLSLYSPIFKLLILLIISALPSNIISKFKDLEISSSLTFSFFIKFSTFSYSPSKFLVS